MNNLEMDLKANVLIVDDVPDNLVLIEIILKKLDVNLIFANSGIEALSKTKDKEIALALLDIYMPEMDGVTLAGKIQSNRKEKIPIIFITAFLKDEIEQATYYKTGIVDFIQKPFNNTVLLSKVEVFLELYRQKQQIKEQKNAIENHVNELEEINHSLNQRLLYESLLSDISGMAVSMDNMDQLFSSVLSVIGENLDLCRTYFFEYLHETYTIRNTHVWCKKGLHPDKGLSKEMSCNHFPYLIETLKSKKIVNVSNIEEIPDKITRDSLRQQNVLSVLAIPLFIKSNFYGFLSFSDCLKHRIWKTEDIEFLLSISRIIIAVIERKRAEDELKNSLEQLHQLSKYVEKVREEERVSIARELHDDLGQALTAVKIDLGIIRQGIYNNEIEKRIIKTEALVSNTIKTVQKITFELRPKIIDDLGLEAGIEWYTAEFSERNGIEVNLNIDSEISVSPDISIVVFRIMQESLTNVVRHAHATKVDIKMAKYNNSINFVLTDNGIGISESKLKSKTSFGLIGMKERADSVGGKLEIYKNNNHGTSLELTFPLV